MSVGIAAAGRVRLVLRASVLAVAVAALAPMTVVAQRLSDARVALSNGASSFTPMVVSSSSPVSPGAAGVMSFIIPGLGSFYAGNGGHGGAHLAIAVISLAVMAAGVAESFSECPLFSEQPCESSGGDALAALGFIGYSVNDIVSIVTAVHDAQKRNAGGAAP